MMKTDRWDINGLWPRVAPMLQKALEQQTERSLEGIYRELMNESMHLFIDPWKSAMVVQVQRFEEAHICMIVLLGGEGYESFNDETKDGNLKYIMDWAKSKACDEVRIVGRDGWKRIFPEFQKMATVLRLAL